MSESFILKPNKGATHRKKRLGAGPGSGHGSTCARGHDGQRSRSGKKRPYVAFEGGQMPLYRRVPKRGFFHMKADSISFNVSDLNRLENGALVSIEKLIEQKIVKNPLTRIYILGDGEITKKVNIEVHRISSSAKEKIEKAGGLVKVLEG